MYSKSITNGSRMPPGSRRGVQSSTRFFDRRQDDSATRQIKCTRMTSTSCTPKSSASCLEGVRLV